MLKNALKAALIALGWLLVLGGGVCAASNFYLSVVDPSFTGLAGLLVVCVLAVLAGWVILKATGAVESSDP